MRRKRQEKAVSAEGPVPAQKQAVMSEEGVHPVMQQQNGRDLIMQSIPDFWRIRRMVLPIT